MPTPNRWDTRCGYCEPGTAVATPDCEHCGGIGFLILHPVAEELLRFLERHLPHRLFVQYPLMPGERVHIARDIRTPQGGRVGTIESVLRRAGAGYVCSVLVDGDREPCEIHSEWLRPVLPLAAAS